MYLEIKLPIYFLYITYFIISLTFGILMVGFYKNSLKSDYNLQTKIFSKNENIPKKTNINNEKETN